MRRGTSWRASATVGSAVPFGPRVGAGVGGVLGLEWIGAKLAKFYKFLAGSFSAVSKPNKVAL